MGAAGPKRASRAARTSSHPTAARRCGDRGHSPAGLSVTPAQRARLGFLQRAWALRKRLFQSRFQPAGEHHAFPTREDGVETIEAHVAGICVRKTGDGWSVLAARRHESRSLYPGKWECGGGQVRGGEGFPAALRRQFFEEFGIDVEPRYPVETYEIQARGRVIPGVRLLCQARAGDVRLNLREFSEYRWLNLPVEQPLDWIGGIKEALDRVTADLSVGGVEFPLRLLDIATISPGQFSEAVTCLQRYRDGDYDGAVTAICGVVDGLTEQLYMQYGLGDHRRVPYHERVSRAFGAMAPEYLASLPGLDQETSSQVWRDHRRAVNHAANVLGEFRRQFSDAHGAQRVAPILVQRSIHCAAFIVASLAGLRHP